MTYHADNPNFLEFWVNMAKMTLKVKINNIHFQYQLRVSHDACLVQIWWFQLKSVTSYCADKVKFMDRQTDGRTDGQTDWRWQWQYHFGLKGQGVKSPCLYHVIHYRREYFGQNLRTSTGMATGISPDCWLTCILAISVFMVILMVSVNSLRSNDAYILRQTLW